MRVRVLTLALSAASLAACAMAASEAGADPMPTVTLQRTPCFGACPSYTVTVTPQGEVRFDGTRFVTATGERRKRIDAEALRTIAAALHRADLPSLRDTYERGAGCERWRTDAPGIHISTQGIAASKSVLLNDGCEGVEAQAAKARLEALAQVIQAQTGIANWIGAPGSARGPVRK